MPRTQPSPDTSTESPAHAQTARKGLWGASYAEAAPWAAGMAAAAAGVLACGKLSLFWATGSMVVGLSAWDSSIDVFISLINQRIVRFARQSADAEHPYGHGKAESIAALGQGALITGGALIIFGSSVRNLVLTLRGRTELVHHTWGVAVFFVVAALLSQFVTWWLRRYGTLFRSPALLADAEHYRVDVLTNLCSAVAIGAMILTRREWLDPLIASGLALYIGWGGFHLMRGSIQELMDHDVSDDVKKQALSLIWRTDRRIVDVHKFRGRKSGHRFFFDFHVTLPAELDFSEVHNIVENIEDSLIAAFDADVVVHADPDSWLKTGKELSVPRSRPPT